MADFCLEMYRRLGLLEGLHVMRSGDPEFRRRAAVIDDYFVDVTYENELVRARISPDGLLLHKGGKSYLKLPLQEHDVTQISPTRDTRLRWMQSVIGCTHYVAGASEIKYLNTADAPGVQFIARDEISESDRAYIPQFRQPQGSAPRLQHYTSSMSDSKLRILGVGAHPDDLEFGCGGVLLAEAARGSEISLCICSRGEAGSNGTPNEREAEARERRPAPRSKDRLPRNGRRRAP